MIWEGRCRVDIAVSLLGESGGPKRQVRYLLITEAENGVQLSMAGEQMMCYTVKGEQLVESYRTCVSHLRSSPSLQSIGVAGRSGLELGLKTARCMRPATPCSPWRWGSNALFGQDGAVSPTLLQTALQAFSYNVSTPGATWSRRHAGLCGKLQQHPPLARRHAELQSL